jgi:hypothetical protein
LLLVKLALRLVTLVMFHSPQQWFVMAQPELCPQLLVKMPPLRHAQCQQIQKGVLPLDFAELIPPRLLLVKLALRLVTLAMFHSPQQWFVMAQLELCP